METIQSNPEHRAEEYNHSTVKENAKDLRQRILDFENKRCFPDQLKREPDTLGSHNI